MSMPSIVSKYFLLIAFLMQLPVLGYTRVTPISVAFYWQARVCLSLRTLILIRILLDVYGRLLADRPLVLGNTYSLSYSYLESGDSLRGNPSFF